MLFFTTPHRQLALLLALLIVIAGLIAAWLVFVTPSVARGGNITTTPAARHLIKKVAPPRVSLLDGRTFPARQTPTIVGVMIENHGSSRPQMRGLPEASIVYETLAEGGITRFLAIYDRQILAKVGPVRSARSYFVDWAAEYGGAYIHAGGSPQAINQIPTEHLRDYDEADGALFRDNAFPRPHNLFVSLTTVERQLIASGWQPTIVAPRFDFSGRLPADAIDAIGLTLDFSLANYRVAYAYDPTDGRYARTLGGVTHADVAGTSVRPTNIIVQFTSNWLLGDDDSHGRLGMQTTGEGTAWYFSGGKYWVGTWSKVAGGRTEFVDAIKQPISLRAGQTWIEVIDSPSKVTVKNPAPVVAVPTKK